jgi:hypothetical protein
MYHICNNNIWDQFTLLIFTLLQVME